MYPRRGEHHHSLPAGPAPEVRPACTGEPVRVRVAYEGAVGEPAPSQHEQRTPPSENASDTRARARGVTSPRRSTPYPIPSTDRPRRLERFSAPLARRGLVWWWTRARPWGGPHHDRTGPVS